MKTNLCALAVAVAAIMAAASLPANAAPLSGYTSFASYPISVPEASGVTYNRDTGTLYAVGDEGFAVVELSKFGLTLSAMTLERAGSSATRAMEDPEGIAYLGNGLIMLADERRNLGAVTTYVAGATRTLADLTPTSYAFGPPDSNTGLEGVSYDPVTGGYWGVRETSPMRIYYMDGLGGPVTEPISSRNIGRMGIDQVSDIFVMGNSAAFAGTDRASNMILLGRDAKLLVEVTSTGVLVDQLDLSSFEKGTIEGLTMDDDGNIYLVSEHDLGSSDPELHVSQLHVISAVPEPTSCAFVAMGAVGLAGFVRRRVGS